ncbi:MAG: hypothetical protein IT517_15260 [Burkholderiales bacterium]|nr:hypothetical protein [Burkholderiales bacterium]
MVLPAAGGAAFCSVEPPGRPGAGWPKPAVRVWLLRDSLNVFFAAASPAGALPLAPPTDRVLLLRDSLNVFFAAASPAGALPPAPPTDRVLLLRDSLNVFFAAVSPAGATVCAPAAAGWTLAPVAPDIGAGCASARRVHAMHAAKPTTASLVNDIGDSPSVQPDGLPDPL